VYHQFILFQVDCIAYGSVSQTFFKWGPLLSVRMFYGPPLLLSPLKANCLRFSTTVCDTQFTLILFFLSFFLTNVQSKRTTRAEHEDHLWSADHCLGNAVLHEISKRKANYIGHSLRRNCSLQQVIEGKVIEGIETAGRRGRRRSKLLDDLKPTAAFPKLFSSRDHFYQSECSTDPPYCCPL
jgi:hypothetical protein